MRHITQKEQIKTLKRENAELRTQLVQQQGDIDFLAMCVDVELEQEDEDEQRL